MAQRATTSAIVVSTRIRATRASSAISAVLKSPVRPCGASAWATLNWRPRLLISGTRGACLLTWACCWIFPAATWTACCISPSTSSPTLTMMRAIRRSSASKTRSTSRNVSRLPRLIPASWKSSRAVTARSRNYRRARARWNRAAMNKLLRAWNRSSRKASAWNKRCRKK